MRFTVTDLFVVGVGLDMSGAYLVARGLLIPFPQLKIFGQYGGQGAADVVDRAKNRVDAQFGIGLLLAGFLFQFAGYAFELNGEVPHSGSARLVGALVLLVLAIGISLGAWRLARHPLFMRTLVNTAMAPSVLTQPGKEETLNDKINNLASYGPHAGHPQRPGESNADYVGRVFGVPPPDDYSPSDSSGSS